MKQQKEVLRSKVQQEEGRRLRLSPIAAGVALAIGMSVSGGVFAAGEIFYDANDDGTISDSADSPLTWVAATHGSHDIQINADATINSIANTTGGTIGNGSGNAIILKSATNDKTLTITTAATDGAVVIVNGDISRNSNAKFNLTVGAADTGDAAFTLDINGAVDLGEGVMTVVGEGDATKVATANVSGNLTAASVILNDVSDTGTTVLVLDGSSVQIVAAKVVGGADAEGKMIVNNAAGVTFSGLVGEDSNGGADKTLDLITIGSTNADSTATFQTGVSATQITLGDGSNTDTITLNLAAQSAAMTVTGDIDGTAGDTSTINVVDATNAAAPDLVTITGEIGNSTAVTNLNVGSATQAGKVSVSGVTNATNITVTGGNAAAEDSLATLSGAVTADAINVTSINNGGDATLTLVDALSDKAGGSSLATTLTDTATAKAYLIADSGAGVTIAGTIDGAADNEGTLKVEGGTNLTTFSGNIGAIYDLLAITVGGATDDGDAKFSGTVAAQTITVSGTTAGDNNANFDGAVTAGSGGINITGAAASTATASFADNVTGAINLTKATSDATVTFDGTSSQTIGNAITANSDGDGAIVVTNTHDSYAIFSGAIGASAGNKVGSLTVGGSTIVGNAKFDSTVDATDINIGHASDWGGADNTVADFNGVVTASTIDLVGGTDASNVQKALATFSGNVTATAITLNDDTTVANLAQITFDGLSDQTIGGTIDGGAAGEGGVVVGTTGTTTFSGIIGGSAAIKSLSVSDGATVSLSKAVSTKASTDGVAVAAGGTLNVTDNLTMTHTQVSSTGDGLQLTGNSGSSKTATLATGVKKLTVAGNVTLDDQVLWTLNINGATTAGTDYSQISAASHTVVIDDANKLTITPTVPNAVAAGTQLKLIDATTLTFNNSKSVSDITVTDNSKVMDYVLSVDSNDLMITFNSASASSMGIATRHEVVVNRAFGALADGTDNTAWTAFSGLSTAAATEDAVEQMQPNNSASAGAASAAAGAVAGVVGGHQSNTTMASNRYGTARFASLTGESGISTGDTANEQAAWGQFFGSNVDQNLRNGVDGYTGETAGMALGWDTEVSADQRVGVSLSYAKTDVDGESASESQLDSETWQGSVYGTQYMKEYYIDWMVGYAEGDTDSQRTVDFGGLNRLASASYDSKTYSAKVGAGMPMDQGTWTMTPKADLSLVRIVTEEYTETGAGNLNLKVASADYDMAVLSFGSDFATRIEDANGVTIPRLSIMANYDMANEAAKSTNTFTGGGTSFVTEGAKAAEWGGKVGLGLDYESNHDESVISFDYSADMKQDFVNHAGSITFRKNF